jgi:hypothetical protein
MPGLYGDSFSATAELTPGDSGPAFNKAGEGTLPADPLSKTFAYELAAPAGDTTAPTITSSATASVAENAAFSLTLTANETVTWTKTGGADAALFTLTGNTLTMTARDYDAPSDANLDNVYVVQVTATDTAGNPTAQTINVTVTNVLENTLATLTLSPLTATQSSAYSGTISGRTTGSTITATSSDGTTLTVSGTTVSGTFSTTGSKTITLTETIADATNSPRVSTQTVTVSAPAATLNALTLSPLTATQNVAYSGTISGKTTGSTITATSSDGATLTVSGTTVSGTFTTTGSKTITLTETLAGATNTPRVSTQTVTVSAASGVTWNTADSSSGITYTNSNLTATNTSTLQRSARGTKSFTTQKVYFEIVVGGAMATNDGTGVGVATSATSLASTSYVGKDANSFGLYYNGAMLINDAVAGTNNPVTTGQVIRVAVDGTNKKIWFSVNGAKWNANTSADPATNVGGMSISSITGAMFPMFSLFNSDDAVTLRPNSASFSFTAPSGFVDLNSLP